MQLSSYQGFKFQPKSVQMMTKLGLHQNIVCLGSLSSFDTLDVDRKSVFHLPTIFYHPGQDQVFGSGVKQKPRGVKDDKIFICPIVLYSRRVAPPLQGHNLIACARGNIQELFSSSTSKHLLPFLLPQSQ